MPRQDAVRNRERLVASARQVFADRGFEATLDEIAAQAGLGVGTAYRHFRNKQELAAVILADATEQIVTDAEAALAIDDPWEAVVSFFEATAARQSTDRGLYEALQGMGAAADKDRLWPTIVETVTALFDHARQAEVIRADARPEDVVAMFVMLGAIYDIPTWHRYLTLMLDGLRATDRPNLADRPPTFSSLDEMVAVSKRGRTRGSRRAAT